MKNIYNVLIAIIFTSLVITGCDDMLDVDSDRIVNTDDYALSSANDTLKSMIGLFSQLQKIGERYVLLGELRGDLMDVTANATTDLKQIGTFSITADNPYVAIKDYYSIINNCNFLISKLDTNIVTGGMKLVYREYAAIKALRAWTYLQIALNYGKAVYFEAPLLTMDDANKDYPEYDINQLAPFLINDLLPLRTIKTPIYGEVGKKYMNYAFIPVRFVLGELYLWTGKYREAANEYHDLIYEKKCVTNYKSLPEETDIYNCRSNWSFANGAWIAVTNYWGTYTSNYSGYSGEYIFVGDVISEIVTSSEFGVGGHLNKMAWPYITSGSLSYSYADYNKVMIVPSNVAISNWDTTKYYDVDPLNFNRGDLRGYYGSYLNENVFSLRYESESYGITFTSLDNYRSAQGMANYISKFRGSTTDKYEAITTCSTGLLYLRYAEAVNRLYKPNLAFAVLKYGLNRLSFLGNSKIPSREKLPFENYMNFDDSRFDNNIGMHARGCGYVENATGYSIEEQVSLEDSVKFVEDKIIEELALETAFQGNRFHDLMRVAIRRNDNSFLANKIAKKNNPVTVDLTDRNNWYLPKK